MSELARERLEGLGRLWRREREAARERLAAERRGVPLAERVARGVALTDLVLEDADPAPGGRTLLWLVPRRGIDMDGLRVGPGDPVRLWWEDPDARDVVRATVARRRGGRLGVMVHGDVPERCEQGPMRLDRDDPEVTFDRGDDAVRRFLHAAPGGDLARLRDVLLGDRAPRFKPGVTFTPLDPDLNEPQREAVARALAAEDVALVHGPPGTGKTRTLVEVVRQLVARGERVLATAASNTAVDNLAERLVAAGVEVVRLGHPARLSPAMEARGLDALLERSEAFELARRWVKEAHAERLSLEKRRARGKLDRDEAREGFREFRAALRDARAALQQAQEEIVRHASVVAATAAGADSFLLGDLVFDAVVLDEATQAVDPVALVALARGKRVVLAGDPCQLPPTVIDREAERAGLGRTVFEGLAERAPDAVRMLVVQHRMHETLMWFPSERHYGGKLRAAEHVAKHRLEDLPGVAQDDLRPGPLVFVDCAGKGWEEERGRDDPSTRNPGQARRVAQEVRRLLARGLPPGDLAVITPYDAQVRLLRELLQAELGRGLEVGTVDGFQGREKEAIVVDLVRSNEEGEIGFLGDTRRCNVAITRARRFLLLVGDSGTVGQAPYYEALLAAVGAVDGWISAWSDDAE